MKIYNIIKKQYEDLFLDKEKEITIYVCGPTVYNKIHLGNARITIFFDTLKKYLLYKGYKVKYVSNITDIDDKIIKKAIEENKPETEIAKRYIDDYIYDITKLNCQLPDLMPKATSYLDEMIDFINVLIEKDFAYLKNNNVYFRVRKVKDYGLISGQDIDNLNNGIRIDIENDKEDLLDFNLWKKTNEGIQYPSPFGPGRPGWHTECAVMNNTIFKDTIFIHGGGLDLKFPHHENERAQFFAYNQKELATYWMHLGFINFNMQKMSKSLGNIVFIRELIEKNLENQYRFLTITHHYQSPINFSYELLNEYDELYKKFKKTYKLASFKLFLNNISNLEYDQNYQTKLDFEMDNNFNTPNILTILIQLTKDINKEKDLDNLCKLVNIFKKYIDILGIDLKVDDFTNNDKEIYLKWLEYRNLKDFENADNLRNKLIERELI